MPEAYSHFDLDATLIAVRHAFKALVCNVAFDAALHGLALALIVVLIGLILAYQHNRFGLPLIAVARKLTLFCLIMAIPGTIALIQAHKLPSTGTFHMNSIGFVIFWIWICVHLSAEEMNFEWFSRS